MPHQTCGIATGAIRDYCLDALSMQHKPTTRQLRWVHRMVSYLLRIMATLAPEGGLVCTALRDATV